MKLNVKLRGLMLRMPENLRRRLEREAEQHHRSMNAEIIQRLELSDAENQAITFEKVLETNPTMKMIATLPDLQRALVRDVDAKLETILELLRIALRNPKA